jgi:hypothetical protein
MEQITRRNVLPAGLALPAILETTFRESQGTDDATKKPKRFEEVAGFEVAQAISECPLAILPLGSLEFHGPHNPLGSDSIIISGIAENVAARTNGLLFPVVKFTQCPAHTAHFQGTLSVRLK